MDVLQSTQDLRYTRSVRFETNRKMEVSMVQGHCAATHTALPAKQSALSGVHLILNVSGRHETYFRTRKVGTYSDVHRAAWHSGLGQHSGNVAGQGALKIHVMNRGMSLLRNRKSRLTA